MVKVPKKEDAGVTVAALYNLSDMSESIRKKGVGNFKAWKICERECVLLTFSQLLV